MMTRLLTVGLHPARVPVPLQRPTLGDLPALAGMTAVVSGLVVLVGWITGLDPLIAIIPGAAFMKANTAVCFVLMGAGVAFMAQPTLGPRRRRIGLAFVGGGTAIALTTGSQYLTGRDLGIDQLLFRDLLGQGAGSLGRMSPLSAVAFVLIGGSAITVVTGKGRLIGLAFASAAILISLLNVAAFVFNAAVPSFLAGYTEMAVTTAAAMSVLGLGVIGLLGPANPFAPLANRSAASRVFRRLFAVSMVIPVLMAWARLEGQKLGLYDTSYGLALTLVGSVALLVVAMLYSARVANDLEARREASEIERDRFFEMSIDMLCVMGSDGRFRRVNQAWASALGYPAAELVGRASLDFVHPDDVDRTLAETERNLLHGEPTVGFVNRYRHRDGRYRWLEWMSRIGPDGSVAFSVARDVTDRKHDEDRRAHQKRRLQARNESLTERAARDPLTGLHNRRHFDAAVGRLERRWARLPADRRPPVAVVIFDLDHFGQVNKLHGHQAGDAVLRQFAAILQRSFREGDLVARYGGEEFVAVLEHATSPEVVAIADEIRETLARTQIDIDAANSIRVTVSAGCAQLGDDLDILAGLSTADVWLAQAKRAGRNQVIGL